MDHHCYRGVFQVKLKVTFGLISHVQFYKKDHLTSIDSFKALAKYKMVLINIDKSNYFLGDWQGGP